jgi:TolB-like protein/tetratricopeptide (TPR) repeat protein
LNFFEELKRRNVFRVGIAYGVASWLLLQLSDILAPLLNLPETAQRYVLFALVIGFVPALIFAWAFEMTPEGLKKEKDVDRSQSVVPKAARSLDRTIIVVLALAVGFLLYKQMGQQSDETDHVAIEPPIESIAPEQVQKSVAVLPFVNMSSDPEQEYFSDGLSEELLNRLAKNDQLHVAARTSAFQFKGQNLDISDIGRQLNVAHVLEGSVRKAGNRLRITAQLIQVDNGFHLWSETYEREMDDVFAIQDEIAVAISEAMEIELGTSSNLVAGSKPTSNLEAYNHYLQARFLLAQRGDENMRKADEMFNKAVALDPEFADAWSGMAFNMTLLYGYSPTMSLEESFSKTMNAAERALELDPLNAEAYTAIGRAHTDNFNYVAAEEYFDRAYQLGPNDVGVLNLYGDFMGDIGDFDRAIELKMQAIDLDPLSPVHASDLAGELINAGRYDEAVVSARRGVSLAPESFARFASLVEALIMAGEFTEVRLMLEQSATSFQNDPEADDHVARSMAMIYYRENNTAALREVINQAIEDEKEGRDSLGVVQISFFLLALDGAEAALPWLEKALTDKENNLLWSFIYYLPERMSQDPQWLAFWDHPMLKELLDMRRANPYPTNGLWKPQSELNGMTE